MGWGCLIDKLGCLGNCAVCSWCRLARSCCQVGDTETAAQMWLELILLQLLFSMNFSGVERDPVDDAVH
jgi:pentatricopeptide repeat protein